ncbi:M23 family metallopeptidase [Paenibacillus hexagrammi]|uniref:Peptidoglycan DD-metalloendopeptidase family protein n=1 Tax=Paenibacillus hexagrammi TaxID=2908839 RepID=A0ABY3SMQ7_9BACL|nr:M23 family metallopeptidase [Paenibacillus sp. YPD9-1]UJF34242.1 peptidoglycan DD-metalloendopeptidase family protein [Paenibacillus sp. YPD9-1]
MKLKWKPKKLTLVIIPEANQSIVRFRITNLFTYAIATCGSLLLAICLMTYALHLHTSKAASVLKSQLRGEKLQLSAALTSKNQAIEQLQNEVIQLSQQAEQMKAKVEQMKQLEHELKALSLDDASSKEASGASSAVAQAEKLMIGPALGVGGSSKSVSQDDILKLGEQTSASLTALNTEVSKLGLSLAEAKRQQEKLRAIPSIWPTTTKLVTSNYGYRKDPFTAKPSFHAGIDFGAKANEPVFAAADGKVVSTGTDRFHGNNIIVEHTSGLRTWYMHLNKMFVRKGEHVEKGQKIGLVGSTGRSTGPHLHYEILKNGKSVDPKPYLKTVRKEAN